MGDEQMVYISGQEAAKRLGCAAITVSRIARRNRIGIIVEDGRLAALAVSDLVRLRPLIRETSGNPAWIEQAARKPKRKRG
jgi:hypothetical protein